MLGQSLPQPFETVVFAGFLVHDVDDEITVVEQHPLAFGQAFARSPAGVAGLEGQSPSRFPRRQASAWRSFEALAMSIASVMANGLAVTSDATVSVAFMRSAAAAAIADNVVGDLAS